MPDGPGRFATGRHAGALVPLFSIPSRSSWGIGEIPDLARFARWLTTAGLGIVQLLPVNEMQEGQNSPYSALSAMAIDPIFIAVHEVADFADAGGVNSLTAEDRRRIDEARAAPRVDHDAVRRAKTHALRLSYGHFTRRHWGTGSVRAAEFRGFCERERWWLDEYGLFRALHDQHEARYWLEWAPGLRDRDPAALAAARERLAPEILYYEYLQWLADEQWQRARRDCGAVGIFGDFPFMVSGHSADVWSRQHEFRLEASTGVPPDAFSESGQDWGLPVYRWDVIEPGGYEWLRQRVRRCTELYDGFRVDHLVGFYRTFFREQDGTTHFIPEGEARQLAQGERLMALFADSGARIIVEDLGTVPDFVRRSLRALRVPGLKVLRWERDWDVEGQPFRDPAAYPQHSVATSGTHDNEPLAEWWDSAGPDERRCVEDVPMLRAAGCSPEEPFSPAVRDALLEALYASGSDLLLIPVQDIFGWRDRINTPASVSDTNWTWRMPWPIDDLTRQPDALERARVLRMLADRHGRAIRSGGHA
jgi:4-alpha-glucanotransferase